MLSLENSVIKNEQTAYRNIDTEGLIMNPSDNTLHSLNEVACSVWEFITEERKVSDIVTMVLENYDADSETVTRDVIEHITALHDQGLVIVK
jgi:hypothetical protein